MACSAPNTWRSTRRSLLLSTAAALALTPGTAVAQQSASHPASAPRHPVVIVGAAHPVAAAMPRARVATPLTTPRTGVRPRWPASTVRNADVPPVARDVQPARDFPERDSFQPIFETPAFFQPFFFSAPFAGGFGFAGSVSRFDGMPMGFGLWPACDSAGTPGVFATVGPCFGIGSYSEELAPSVGSEYPLGAAPPSGSVFPLIFLATPPVSGPPAAQNPGAPAPAPTMLLYLTGGKTIAAADWWVTRGRLQYVTDSGVQGSMELSQLDLEQTIKQNETRGLQFHLKFTPPSER